MSSQLKFELEGNLVFLVDIELLDNGGVVCHSRDLWCEAVDRAHARYIYNALNKVGIKEVLDGSKQDNR